MNDICFPLITEEEKKLPFYIKGIGIQREQEPVTREEGHPDFHWIHGAKGCGRLLLEGKEWLLHENMGFFLYPGTPHEYHSLEGGWETHWITFGGYGAEELLKQVGLGQNRVFYLQDVHLLEETFEQMRAALSHLTANNGHQASVYLYQFLILLRTRLSENSRVRYDKVLKLDPVVSYLEQHYSESPTLTEMAELIGVTPNHLCRLFKEVFKLRPFEYLTKIRIMKAKEWMALEDVSIKYVALATGYNDVSYFCSIFKEHEGVTPTEFRNMQRSRRSLGGMENLL